MKKESNYEEMRSARWGVLHRKDVYRDGVGEVQNEHEGRQI